MKRLGHFYAKNHLCLKLQDFCERIRYTKENSKLREEPMKIQNTISTKVRLYGNGGVVAC